ncbi:glycoside hydrolase superfamily [Zopfochytrium polystomum]|nr:glycoside hydrolase superfamily [Zopfochytrium polystomum]
MDSWVVRKGNSLVKVPIAAAAAAAAAVTTTSPAAPSTPQSSPSTTAASATTTNSRASPSPTADTTNGNNSTASATAETPFRFVSFNVPNLFYLEDRPNATTGERLGPTLFEQQDAVATIAYLRGSVIRTYTLSYQSNTNLSKPAYHVAANITAFNGTKWSPIPNTANPRLYLNEDLFAALDSAVAIAHNHSVRLIIPFIDRWAWWGGIEAFASLHAKPLGNATTAAPDFFTDPTVTANFFALVTAVVNRTNNAVSPPRRYCEDPAILAWETGNELQTLSGGRVPANWTLAVARTVKDVLRTQLVLDGSDGARTGWQEEVLDDPDVDLFAGHYYDFVMAPAAAGSDEVQGPVGWPVVVTAVATAIGVMLVLVLWMKPQWIVPSTTRKQKRQSLARADETRRGDQPLDNLFLQAVSQSSPSTADTTTTTPCPPNPPRPRHCPTLRPLLLLLATLFTLTCLSLLALSLSTRHTQPPLPQPLSPYPTRLATDLATITPHRKPFLVGEFGLTATSNVRDLLTAVTTANASCVGAMLWSLRFRARDGGFYVHDEGGGYEAYHDRGGAGMGAGVVRAAGFGADEGAVMALMRGAAAAVSGVSNASLAVVPAPPPVVLRTGNATTVANGTAVVGVRWRGSVGAARYRVERSVVGAAEGFVVVTEDGSEAIAAGGTAAAAEAMLWTRSGRG